MIKHYQKTFVSPFLKQRQAVEKKNYKVNCKAFCVTRRRSKFKFLDKFSRQKKELYSEKSENAKVF